MRKDIACHLRVAVPRVQIVAECLGLLGPDDGINLKETKILRIAFTPEHLPIARPLLPPTFALGNPLEHGRQRILLYHDHRGRWLHLGARTACLPPGNHLAKEGAEAEQQPTHHEGHQAAWRPCPATTTTGADPRQRNLAQIRLDPPPLIALALGGPDGSHLELPLQPDLPPR
mgnify:CR=1 FL=1